MTDMPMEIWVEPPPFDEDCAPEIFKVEITGYDKYHHDSVVRALREENDRLKLVIAKAALNILENPHNAISDTLWMGEGDKIGGCTMYEFLASEFDSYLVGLPHDEEILRALIKEKHAQTIKECRDD